MQEVLKPFLTKTCYHLKGHGELKGAVRDVMKELPKPKYFCKTDVHSYYDSINHYTMLMRRHGRALGAFAISNNWIREEGLTGSVCKKDFDFNINWLAWPVISTKISNWRQATVLPIFPTILPI